MKKLRSLVLTIGLLALLAAPAASLTYNNSPGSTIVFPEIIWAAASGGGTWASELQITDMTGGSVVSVVFSYGTTTYQHRDISGLWTGTVKWNSVKFSNILSTMQSLDPSFTYYGKVGAMIVSTQDDSHKIQAIARTVNGDYGKTFPGLRQADMNTANLGRNMEIQDLTQNADYRTFVGFFNSTYGAYAQTVQFTILDDEGEEVGSPFSKTFAAWTYLSFNPFAEAGVGSGTYDNCRLYIQPTASGSSGIGSWGLFCFGSSANNHTNDTSAHIAVQLQ